MRPVRVKWGRLDFEMPGEVALFLLLKLFLVVFYLLHI